MTITLRAVCSDDEPFLLQVYASTRADELAMVPWSVEQKQAFVQLQFNAQAEHYRIHRPDAEYWVILRDQTPIGRLIVDRANAEIFLMDIALLPPYHNAGFGTALIRDLMNEARAARKPLRLHVEFFNPALRLYERLGFRKISEMGIYHQMEWTGDTAPGERASAQPNVDAPPSLRKKDAAVNAT